MNARECTNPALLVAVDVVSEGLNDGFIGAFASAVCHGMEGGRHLDFYNRDFVKGGPERAVELAVAVRDDFCWETIFAEPSVEEDVGELSGGAVSASRNDVNVGSKTVRECCDGVVSLVFREGSNEIDCDTVTVLIWYWEGMQWSRGFGGGGFETLAIVAGGDIALFEVTTHIRPVVRSAERGVCFVGAKVAKGIVGESVEGFAEVINAGDYEAVVEEKESVLETCTEIGLRVFKEFRAERVFFVICFDVKKEVVVPCDLKDGGGDGRGWRNGGNTG